MLRGIAPRKILTVILLMMSLATFAQQQYHFVYIQADNQQPFYLKYQGKNYSSTSIGYLILPKLTDGPLSVQIGFPKNLYPEQTFSLTLSGKDLGYGLKNFEDKGWGLFNFQTTDVVMNSNAGAASATASAQPTTTTDKSNPFGNMLASAVNDSTLNQKTISADTLSVKTETAIAPKPDSAASVAVTQQPAAEASQPVVKDSTVVAENKKETSPQSDSTSVAKTADSNITKSAETVNSNGTDLTFLDNNGKDTIHAFIPSGSKPADTLSVESKAAVADSAKGKVDNPFFSGSPSGTTSTGVATDSGNSAPVGRSNVITNSSCEKMLSTYDADRLKKKIISLDNQDKILEAVRKTLRDKCVTTEQVKDFGNLFLSDENRYGFYDAVYSHVSDYFNYPQLQSTLIDTYYKNRFKALLRQP